VLVSECLAAKRGHETELKCHIHKSTKTTQATIYKQKLIITSIKQLFTEFPELFLLSYDYILSTSVSGPLKKHLDSLKPRVDLPKRARTGGA
jgi:hypothetical protein